MDYVGLNQAIVKFHTRQLCDTAGRKKGAGWCCLLQTIIGPHRYDASFIGEGGGGGGRERERERLEHINISLTTVSCVLSAA